jgi:hypothetical protein
MTHKKIILAGLVILLAGGLILTGCGKKTTVTNTTNTGTPNVNAEANTNAAANTNSGVNTNSATGITKVELQRLPKGVTFSTNVNMATTNSFSVGDSMGFNVTGTFAEGSKLTFAILDSNGNIAEPQGMSLNLINGSNGNCCFGLPTSAGSYTVKFYVNGTEGYSLPMTLIE